MTSPLPYALTLVRRPDGLAEIVFDKPGKSVNTIDLELFVELDVILTELEKNPPTGLLLKSGKPGQFIAGADVGKIAALIGHPDAAMMADKGRDAFSRFARLPFPTAALVTGAALGGGLEWALVCDLILCADDPAIRLGLPEVQLGILPAWGGTSRLPRRVGLMSALEMLLQGKRLDPKRALKAGLVDGIAPLNQLEELALKRLQAAAGRKPVATPPGAGLKGMLLEGNPFGRSFIFSQARKNVMKATQGHYPAPLLILDTVQKSWGAPLETALAFEAEAIKPLIVSDVARSLVGIFMMSEAAKKNPFLNEGEKAATVQRAMVIGAGVMGSGIAVSLLQAGMRVWLKEVAAEPLLKGVKEAEKWLGKDAARRRLPAHEARAIRQRLTPVLADDALTGCDLVIEAVVEKMAVKKQVFAACELKAPATALLTSNTSSLSLTDMQTGLARPENVAGLHFFNPAPLMPLVEIIRGDKTSPETLGRLYALVLKMGKTPVVVKDGPGFLVNRLLAFYLNEAAALFAAGVPVEALDRALKSFGMPMGPAELLDVIGIDVAVHAGGVLEAAWPARATVPELLKNLVAQKRLGKKSGAGFYGWQGEKKGAVIPLQMPVPSTPATPSASTGEAADWTARCIYPMINEAATCLDEGLVDSPAALDLAMIFGTGFAPFRGGLLKYADTLGAKAVADKLTTLAAAHGPHLAPSPALRARAAAGRKFHPELNHAARESERNLGVVRPHTEAKGKK